MKKTIVTLMGVCSLLWAAPAEATPATFGIKAGVANSNVFSKKLSETFTTNSINIGFPAGVYGSYAFTGYAGLGLDVSVLIGQLWSGTVERKGVKPSFTMSAPRLHIGLQPILYPWGASDDGDGVGNIHLILHCGIPIADGEVKQDGPKPGVTIPLPKKDLFVTWGGGAGIGYTISYLMLGLDCIYEFTNSADSPALGDSNLLCISLTAGFNFAPLFQPSQGNFNKGVRRR